MLKKPLQLKLKKEDCYALRNHVSIYIYSKKSSTTNILIHLNSLTLFQYVV